MVVAFEAQMVMGSSVFKTVSGFWSLILSVELTSVLVALTVCVSLCTLTSLVGFILALRPEGSVFIF